jgi:hypothetical protein
MVPLGDIHAGSMKEQIQEHVADEKMHIYINNKVPAVQADRRMYNMKL